jgi:hypothetical protein
MSRHDEDPRPDVEHPDDARGAHNRIGYFDVDETDSSSERGAEEPEVAEEVEQQGKPER